MSSADRGFSLVEIMVVIALFGVIVALGLFLSFESYRSATFRLERDTIVGVLQKARSRSLANIDESAWGVHYEGSPAYAYTIYKQSGGIRQTLDTVSGNQDSTVSPAPFDVLFTQLSGTTTPTTITIAENSRNDTVRVNYEGTIIW